MINQGMSGGSSFSGGKAGAKEALKHFATAFAFLIAGLIALVLNSESLVSGGERSAQVVAGLHFLTLGWLTLSIFGALQVFSGVALGGEALNDRLPRQARWIWSLGLFLFVAGFLLNRTAALAAGFLLLGLALVLYTMQVIPALLRAKRGHVTRVFIAIAFFSLWWAWTLGVTGGLARMGWAPALKALPPGYFQAHILFAVFGWVGSMVIGVGSHLVPMFALSRDCSRFFLKLALAFWIALPLSTLVATFYPTPWTSLSWKIAAAGSLAWVIQFFIYLWARIRREKDEGLLIGAVATSFLPLAWIGAGLLQDPVTFLALTVVGWLSLFTFGIYHRVIPFLVWFMRFSQPAKGVMPPRVKDLLNPALGAFVVIPVALGVLVWTLALWQSSLWVAYAGSGLMLSGVLCALLHLRTLFAPHNRNVKEAAYGPFKRSGPATS